MIHNSLKDYYTVIFTLVQHHKYSMTEIENLVPYERDLYLDMLAAHLESTRSNEN